MYIFIINPAAGSGRAERIFSDIQKSTLYKGITSKVFRTKAKGHAEDIARDLITTEKDPIVAFIVIGGDGTMHEVINGIGKHSAHVAMIPSGSGNDFSRATSTLKKPLDILQAVIEGAEPLPYWLGNYQVGQSKKRTFVNSIGFGFDAAIVETANQSFYKKVLNKLRLGKLSYVIALIHVLIRFKPLNITLEVHGKKRLIKDCWMVTIANHPYYGGGMKIIPDAVVRPAVFPVLIIHSISKWKVLGLFMTVFTGKHTRYKEVELLEATTMRISSDVDMYYQVDGEPFKSSEPCVITKQSRTTYILGTGMQKDHTNAL